ncbi:flagellar basal body rod protein FlgB [Chelativorans intermedius]|uniref:Flagellar basal body rod protein FlgB n=1 Tax=Chelativorans intermedius TaxID=515947 RepID=A0ABV6D8V4_9HYPH|nr:flagellar basal body rod protein FlgB [Chelativorans intermedius]MCT8997789.1 flagellar basal body rod protein FlgB [Chelativorans intermedius]
MQPVNLFDLATQQARWLSVRQATVAGNIANINTPGYKAIDVEPFESVLGGTRVALQATNPLHQKMGATEAGFALNEQEDVELLPSENSVVLENELIKAGEIRRAFELNTAIVKAFHRMMTMTARG